MNAKQEPLAKKAIKLINKCAILIIALIIAALSFAASKRFDIYISSSRYQTTDNAYP